MTDPSKKMVCGMFSRLLSKVGLCTLFARSAMKYIFTAKTKKTVKLSDGHIVMIAVGVPTTTSSTSEKGSYNMRSVSTSEMIQAFGEEEYIKANEAFAGRKHHFPKNLKLMTDEERNQLIAETVWAYGYNVAAEEFAPLSKSRIYEIVNEEQNRRAAR